MFLIERIVGFGLYMLVLLFVCTLLAKTNTACKPTLKLYTLCLCVMAFFYKPYVTADLYRIYDTMTFFAEMDFFTFFENFALESSTPVARLIYWCIGKTGINELLPTFSSLICYSFIFYIMVKTQEMFSVSKKNVALTLFFVMTTSIYISVIGGIRMMLALSMIAFSFFRGTVEKRVTVFDILLYVLSIFIHAMSFVVIGICLLVILSDNQKSINKKMIFVCAVVIIGFAFIHNISDLIDNIIDKFLEYVFGDRHSDTWEYIMGVLIMMLLGILVCEYRRMQKIEKCLVLRGYNMVIIACMTIAIIFSFEFSIFYRFGGQLAVIFSIPMMMITLENSRGKPSKVIKGTNFRSLLMGISFIIALISCTRGSLSSLKFFEL